MALGNSEGDFWDLTPRQIVRAFEAGLLKRKRDHNDRMSLAWHVAVLQRTEKMPALDRLTVREGPRIPDKPQSWQEQKQIMTMIAAAYSGSTKVH